MRNHVRAIAVTALIPALVGACSETTAPAETRPQWFGFELAVTGARSASFSGELPVTTAKNGHSEQASIADPTLITRDYTAFSLAQPDLAVLDTNAYLAVGLIGPFDVGSFMLKTPVSGTDGQQFTGSYSVRLAPGVWEHYEITGGTITLFRKEGNRLSGTFELQSKRVQRFTMGVTAYDTTTLTLSGRMAALPH